MSGRNGVGVGSVHSEGTWPAATRPIGAKRSKLIERIKTGMEGLAKSITLIHKDMGEVRNVLNGVIQHQDRDTEMDEEVTMLQFSRETTQRTLLFWKKSCNEFEAESEAPRPVSSPPLYVRNWCGVLTGLVKRMALLRMIGTTHVPGVTRRPWMHD